MRTFLYYGSVNGKFSFCIYFNLFFRGILLVIEIWIGRFFFLSSILKMLPSSFVICIVSDIYYHSYLCSSLYNLFFFWWLLHFLSKKSLFLYNLIMVYLGTVSIVFLVLWICRVSYFTRFLIYIEYGEFSAIIIKKNFYFLLFPFLFQRVPLFVF